MTLSFYSVVFQIHYASSLTISLSARFCVNLFFVNLWRIFFCLLRSAGLDCHLQDLGNVQRFAPGQSFNLLVTAKAISNDESIWSGSTHGRHLFGKVVKDGAADKPAEKEKTEK